MIVKMMQKIKELIEEFDDAQCETMFDSLILNGYITKCRIWVMLWLVYQSYILVR